MATQQFESEVRERLTVVETVQKGHTDMLSAVRADTRAIRTGLTQVETVQTLWKWLWAATTSLTLTLAAVAAVATVVLKVI